MTTDNKRATRLVLLVSAVLLLSGCTDKPGSEGWCQTQKEIPKSDRAGEDAKTYAKHCLIDSTTVGSDAWCEDLDETPKNKWTTEEVAQYGQYCVVKKVGDGGQ